MGGGMTSSWRNGKTDDKPSYLVEVARKTHKVITDNFFLSRKELLHPT
jgi:hypothetical protein